MASCMEVSNNSYVPEPLKNIPKDAFWVGDADGGTWYFIESIHSHKNTVRLSLYYESGELIVSKRFVLICSENNQHFITDLKNEINSFDGKKIYLKNGCWLQ